MSRNLTPTVVKQTTFSTEEISRRADPEWTRDRNYTPAYKFGHREKKREFIDHRDNVYQED